MIQPFREEKDGPHGELDGFRIEVNPEEGRGDIILHRPPLNIIKMSQREQMSAAFSSLDQDERIRVIVLRGEGERRMLMVREEWRGREMCSARMGMLWMTYRACIPCCTESQSGCD